MMDTPRIIHLFLQHLPDFLKISKSNKKKSQNSQSSLFASMTNIHRNNEEDRFIYDTDGCLLFMQTAQSNLSLFNVSCDSLVFDEKEDLDIKRSLKTIKHYNSTIDIHLDMKKIHHRSTMIFSEEFSCLKTNTLQRWQRLELLNTCA